MTTTQSTKTTVPASDTSEQYQLIKRSDINATEVEHTGSHVVEVSVLWNTSILHVAHLDADRAFVLSTKSAPRSNATPVVASGMVAGSGLLIAAAATGNAVLGAVGAAMALAGTGAGVALDQRSQQEKNEATRFTVDASMLNGMEELPVVLNRRGATRLVVPMMATGSVEVDGTTISFEQLMNDGSLVESTLATGARELEVRQGARYRMEVGALTIVVRVVAKARVVAGRSRRDPAMLWSGVGAAGVVALAVGSALFSVSGDNMVLSSGNDDERLEAIRSMISRQYDRQPETPPAQPSTEQGASAPGQNGARAANQEGQAGDRHRPNANGRVSIARNQNLPPQIARGTALEIVSQRGAFGALSDHGSPTMGFVGATGQLIAGLSEHTYNGRIDGDIEGPGGGFDGLGRTGPGFGGGNDREGIIGGDIDGTIGVGGRCPIGQVCNGRGPLVGRLNPRGPGRDSHPPMARPGPVSVAGMDREAIRRVVLRNMGQISHCHEQGLMQNPQLSGRVVVMFVVGSTGAVATSVVENSNLSVPSVANCMSEAVRRWTFPAPPDGGVATVHFPFTLEAPQGE